MLESPKNKLKNAASFPSPPAVAQQIIDLASDSDIDVVKVAVAIAKDPGLTARVLRVANSPLYSKQRKSDNLCQALVVLGLNAATTDRAVYVAENAGHDRLICHDSGK